MGAVAAGRRVRPYGCGVFTGLVQAMGEVREVTAKGSGLRLGVEAGGWTYRPGAGDSVAVNGCCLTAVESATPAGLMRFDVVGETLAKTTLGAWAVGRKVNLEHAATMGTLLGGHMVQGHVDGVGRVVANGEGAGGWRLVVEVSAEVMVFMAPKGSVCVDGVSLTLASVDVSARRIEAALIPTTLAVTTLSALRAGDGVNIEADTVAKTVVHYLRAFGGLRALGDAR